MPPRPAYGQPPRPQYQQPQGQYQQQPQGQYQQQPHGQYQQQPQGQYQQQPHGQYQHPPQQQGYYQQQQPDGFYQQQQHAAYSQQQYNASQQPYSSPPGAHQQYTSNTQQPYGSPIPQQPYGSPMQQQQHTSNAPSPYAPPGLQETLLPQIFGGDASGQVGIALGTQVLSAGSAYISRQLVPGVVAPRYSALKTYFDVTNTYVVRKVALILFPFRHASWQRVVLRDAAGQPAGHAPPRADVNAVDLYIPLMATVTYVLLVGLVLGLRRAFRPEALGVTLSGATVFVACELALIKLVAYLLALGGGGVRVLDVLATIGYNFVSITATLAAELALGRRVRVLAFAYTSLAMAFFMLRSLRHSFLPDPAAAGDASGAANVSAASRRRRVYFLFGVVLVQILCSYMLLV